MDGGSVRVHDRSWTPLQRGSPVGTPPSLQRRAIQGPGVQGGLGSRATSHVPRQHRIPDIRPASTAWQSAHLSAESGDRENRRRTSRGTVERRLAEIAGGRKSIAPSTVATWPSALSDIDTSEMDDRAITAVLTRGPFRLQLVHQHGPSARCGSDRPGERPVHR